MNNRQAFDGFLARMGWRQGEHVALIGPTGRGKTNLACHLLRVRERAHGHIMVVSTKPADKTLLQLTNRDYQVTRDWPPSRIGTRYILSPPQTKDVYETRNIHNDVLNRAFQDVFTAGGWCVYVDELFYLSNRLKMDVWAQELLLQGRSLGITMVVGCQRPRNVPVEVYSSATHLFVWSTNDDYDVGRLAGISNIDTNYVETELDSLGKHDVLWMDTREGRAETTLAPRPKG